MSEAAPASIGAVAHYNLLERLEPAGPGELFRARDTRLGRTVAVRLLPPDFVADAAGRESLMERARSLIALSHPNVTTVFDVGVHQGRIYLVFEFLKGEPLRAEMAGRQMNVRRAVELAIQIADGVADAHASGYVHGGLSPDSIMVTAKGSAKIPGFELAAHAGFDQSAPDVRLRDYDSPEEAGGHGVDDRSDVYSVGAILYEMLTTRRPLHRGASAPSASNATVPAEVDAIVLKALSPNVASRYQSAATLVAELRSAAAILDQRERALDEGEAAKGQATSLGRVLALAGIILLGVGLLVAWMMR
jgi:serine/threonine protein kinase